jgi:hypothetical protein
LHKCAKEVPWVLSSFLVTQSGVRLTGKTTTDDEGVGEAVPKGFIADVSSTNRRRWEMLLKVISEIGNSFRTNIAGKGRFQTSLKAGNREPSTPSTR